MLVTASDLHPGQLLGLFGPQFPHPQTWARDACGRAGGEARSWGFCCCTPPWDVGPLQLPSEAQSRRKGDMVGQGLGEAQPL